MSLDIKQYYAVKEYCEIHAYDHDKLQIKTGNEIDDYNIAKQLKTRSLLINEYINCVCNAERKELILTYVLHINENLRKYLGL